MFNYLDVGGGPSSAYMCQKFIKLCTLKISNAPGDSKHMAGGGASFLPVGVGGYRSVKGGKIPVEMGQNWRQAHELTLNLIYIQTEVCLYIRVSITYMFPCSVT